MSRMFNSKGCALRKGFEYGGINLFKDMTLEEILKHSDIKLSDKKVSQLGSEPDNQTVIEFTNSEGMRVTIASCEFREGFDLWLIGENCCIRV